MKIDEIIAKIKEGRDYTIACSMYEETYWYEDGNFYKSMENGIHEPKREKTNEVLVRRNVRLSLAQPEMYDGFFE